MLQLQRREAQVSRKLTGVSEVLKDVPNQQKIGPMDLDIGRFKASSNGEKRGVVHSRWVDPYAPVIPFSFGKAAQKLSASVTNLEHRTVSI